jgi:hypothetical protein
MVTKMTALSESSEQFKKVKSEWREKARNATIDTLPNFLRELSEDYSHDYGTICHAMAVAAVAGASALDNSKQGGISGFQAGAVMWEFIRSWNYTNNKVGLRLVNYDDMLYPQYEQKYEKTISSAVWANLKKVAAEEIAKADVEYAKYLDKLEQYNKDIAAFVEKYPDYYENRQHYDPLSLGTGAEWEAEEKKEVSGFEFAPREPFCLVNSQSECYKHWQSIVDGTVPFGYDVYDD